MTMQIKCGQCGAVQEFDLIEGACSVVCGQCGHAISVSPPADTTSPLEPQEQEGFADQAQRALRERLVLVCNRCGAKMKIARRQAGQVVRCAGCGHRMEAPPLPPQGAFDISFALAHGESLLGRDVATMRRRGGDRRTRLGLSVVLGVVAAVLAITLLGSLVFHPRGPEPKNLASTSPTTTDEGVEPKSTSPAPITDTSPTKRENPQVPMAPRAVEIIAPPMWRYFAAGGFYPAMPGRLYCRLTVRLRAEGREIRLNNFGPAVALTLAGQHFESLGEPVDDALLPLRARQRTILLTPDSPQETQWLFDLPAKGGKGRLTIAGLGELDLDLPDPPSCSGKVAGTYVEQPPRNLRPLLRDPILAAIQAAGNQRLEIRPSGQTLHLWIPEAKVYGEGRQVAPDGCDVILHKGPHSLPAKLRLLPDGRIVLYLRTEPMHQITYVRRSDTPEGGAPDRTPEPPSPLDDPNRPKFFGV